MVRLISLAALVLVAAFSFGCATDGPGGENITRSECTNACAGVGMTKAGCGMAYGVESDEFAKCVAGVDLAREACEFGCQFAAPDAE
jgi:hypothetical protein